MTFRYESIYWVAVRGNKHFFFSAAFHSKPSPWLDHGMPALTTSSSYLILSRNKAERKPTYKSDLTPATPTIFLKPTRPIFFIPAIEKMSREGPWQKHSCLPFLVYCTKGYSNVYNVTTGLSFLRVLLILGIYRSLWIRVSESVTFDVVMDTPRSRDMVHLSRLGCVSLCTGTDSKVEVDLTGGYLKMSPFLFHCCCARCLCRQGAVARTASGLWSN